MHTFNYTARDKKNVITSGSLEGLDKESVANTLGERGLVPLTIAPAKVAKLNMNISDLLKKFKGIPGTEKVIFARQLATMINAGLPLVQSLAILEAQSSNLKMKKVIVDLAKNVEAGTSFSVALSKHPNVFSALFISIIKAGEVGGFLDQVLERLAIQLEKEQELNSKIKGAMIYPAVILFAMVAVSTLMLILVIPKLASLFQDAGIALPIPTQILIALSNFLVNFWFIAFPLMAATIFFAAKFLKTDTGKRIFDTALLKMPIFGGLTKKVSLARFSRMLGSLMTSGIAVLDAMEITADSIGNYKYRMAILEVAKKVRVGVPMAEPLKENPLFTSLVAQMISVGEKTGTLDKILERLAIFYENEVDRIVNNLTTILEPVVILVMGVGVAFLVISLILPILQLTTTF